jgi:cell wall assembly regulator SMI1
MRINAPELLDTLNPGATEDDFKELEELIKREIPHDFKLFYSIHNGQHVEEKGLINADELMSIEGICSVWKTWNELLEEGINVKSTPDKGVKDNWWNPFWIPVTYDGSGNNICMDLDPAEGGLSGQMIAMWHDSDHRNIVSHSFEEWISAYVMSMEKGSHVYAPEWGIVEKDSIFNGGNS